MLFAVIVDDRERNISFNLHLGELSYQHSIVNHFCPNFPFCIPPIFELMERAKNICLNKQTQNKLKLPSFYLNWRCPFVWSTQASTTIDLFAPILFSLSDERTNE